MKLFVYGTLMRNHGNYLRFLENRSVFIGPGETAPSYTMLGLGGFPGVIKGGSTAIKGEVFEITDGVRKDLDGLEGHPSFYKRTPITLADGTDVETYLLQPRGNMDDYPIVKSGDWNRQQST